MVMRYAVRTYFIICVFYITGATTEGRTHSSAEKRVHWRAQITLCGVSEA
jgi:hypothetical protein